MKTLQEIRELLTKNQKTWDEIDNLVKKLETAEEVFGAEEYKSESERKLNNELDNGYDHDMSDDR